MALHSEGYTLAATYYEAVRPLPAGLLLVHGRGRTRRDWEPFAALAQRSGYACFALDLRGHGESVPSGQPVRSYREFTERDWLGILPDLLAAKEFMKARGVDPDNIAIVGADVGGNLALLYALADPEVQAVVMLSPGLDYEGIEIEDAIVEYGNRPSLLMVANGDSYSAQSCRQLKKLAPGFCEIREYTGSVRGVDIIATQRLAGPQILVWLDAIIGPAAAEENRRLQERLREDPDAFADQPRP